MSLVCEDYKNLLTSYANTIPNNNILFRVTKCCGFSQLVTVPRNASCHYTGPILVNLLEQINLQIGEWTRNKVFYLLKEQNYDSFGNLQPRYIHQEDLLQPLSNFSLRNLPTAYSVDECIYTVYQLFLESECNHSCECLNPIEITLPDSNELHSSSSSSSSFPTNFDYIV